MDIGRRDFFKILSAGALTAAGTSVLNARPQRTLSPDAVGILYDATLCIGCKSCEVACKRANDMPMEHGTPKEQQAGVYGIWDSGGDLNSKTLNKIKVYTNGTAAVKDHEIDGYSFVKRACMHCVDPDCISACPVTALTKDDKTGIVKWNPDACIGCRYCQVACPFNIPKFEYDKAFPKIVKCQMCSHLVAEGGMPGCCEYCPTGASLFGKVSDLMEEAKRRLALKEGEEYDYPVKKLGSGEFTRRKAARYQPHLYGETETGGTQYMLLAGVPFDKLGMPSLDSQPRARKSETLQHTIYKGMIAPVVLLGGLAYAAYESSKNDHTGGEE